MAYIGRTPTGSILTGADIADGSISTAKIADTAVSTAKIADDAVGNTKLNLASDYAFTGTVSGTDLTKLLTIDASDSDNISFNSTYITSTYTNYVIKYSRVVPQTDQTSLNFQVSVDNGSTINGDTIVGEQYTNMASSSSGADQHSGSNNGTIVIGYQDDGTDGCSGIIRINGATSTGYKYIDFNHIFRHGGGSDYYGNICYGLVKVTGAYNFFRLLSSSGQIESGKFTLYGEKA